MKGFYIFEEEFSKGTVDCLEIGYIDHTFTHQIDSGTLSEEVKMHALVSKGTKTKCNKDDTYDFETGALIALMKMCGVEKVVRAFNEVFPKETYNTYITKYERELHTLKKDFDKLGDRNKYLIEDINKKLEYIKEKDEEIKHLKEKNAELLGSNSCLRYISSRKESTITSLEKENKELKKNIDELFENEQHAISEVGRLSFEKHRLEEKVEKLKLDCEKLQHGYIDNETIFCGGRQNGKQFTFLVDLFKKLDQKKVDAAYKEAYNTTLPVWQKEVLNQMYGVYKESKEKPELPRTLDINGTVYRKSIQIKDFSEQINKLTVDSLIEEGRAFTRKCIDEWLYKIPTKREEMWERILGDYKLGEGISIKVEKAFINDFLSEAEENGLVWANGGEKPTEWDKWESWRRHDYIVFSLLSVVNPKELTWDITLKENTINYLPPMRWDLFKKGRLAVKVNYDNYKEFYEACEKELGKKPVTAVFTEDFTVSICKKDGLFEIFTVEDQKETGRKIVDWEDVR